jgi:hypothetical protein
MKFNKKTSDFTFESDCVSSPLKFTCFHRFDNRLLAFSYLPIGIGLSVNCGNAPQGFKIIFDFGNNLPRNFST